VISIALDGRMFATIAPLVIRDMAIVGTAGARIALVVCDVKQLRWELDLIETLDEPDPTPSPKRRIKKKTDPPKRARVSRAR
jgi:hypothetical protein